MTETSGGMYGDLEKLRTFFFGPQAKLDELCTFRRGGVPLEAGALAGGPAPVLRPMVLCRTGLVTSSTVPAVGRVGSGRKRYRSRREEGQDGRGAAQNQRFTTR